MITPLSVCLRLMTATRRRFIFYSKVTLVKTDLILPSARMLKSKNIAKIPIAISFWLNAQVKNTRK